MLRRIRRVVRRRPLIIAVALVAIHVLLALLTFAPQPHTGGDNAAYITLARSLIEHGTYSELWDPLAPPHTKYPPAFPSILAVAMVAGLEPWVQLKLVVMTLSATAVAFSFLWLRARRRAALALGVGLILAIAPGVMQEGRWILSDVPFWAFTMMALWAFERLGPRDWKRFAIAAAATLIAYFTRSAGLPLVLAALAWLTWRRSWKQLGALAIVIGVPAVLWLLRTRAYGPSGYVSEFWLVDPYVPSLGRAGIGDMLGRIVDNSASYATVHLPILLTGAVAGLAVLAAILIFLLAVGGWIMRIRHRPNVADLFVPLYLGLILVWPAVWSGERFLLPLLPLLLYYAGSAFVELAKRALPRYGFVTGGAAALLLVLMAIPGITQAARVGRACTALYRAGEQFPCLGSPVWDEFFDVAELAPEMLPPGSSIISRKPRLFHALSGVPGRIYPFSQQPEAFFATVDSIDARYVVFDRLGGTAEVYLEPVVVAVPEAFCIMHATPITATVLFGIRRDRYRGADGPSDPAAALAPCDSSYWRSPEAMQTFGVR